MIGGVSSKDEREKYRGKHFTLVVCDETGSYGAYLSYLLEDVLSAALLDYDGDLVLSGTPSPVAAGPFYDRVHDQSGAWAHFGVWTVLQNSKIPQWEGKPQWRQMAEAYLAVKASGMPAVKFRREYMRGVATR